MIRVGQRELTRLKLVVRGGADRYLGNADGAADHDDQERGPSELDDLTSALRHPPSGQLQRRQHGLFRQRR